MIPVIAIENVRKRFGELTAVDGVSIDIMPGDYVALLGPNGAGKTTLIEMIEGIQQPDEGAIRLLGLTWAENSMALHRSIGLSLQETKFIDKLTVRETLDLFGSFYRLPTSRSEEVLQLVNLEAKQKTYTVNLSGGQRQRLAIGIALLNNPRILLLDEPTTGLDPTARREVWKILEGLRRDHGTTMILTTHYMEEAQYLCERIVIMDKGRIIAQGTLDDLTTRHGEGEVVTVTFSANADLPSTAIPGLKKLTWIVPNTELELRVDNPAVVLPELLGFSARTGNPIVSLTSRKTTLDDLFIQMTGRHLNE